MVGGGTRRGLSATVLLCAVAGCAVQHEKSDLLYEFYECRQDADCVEGWVCRPVTGPDRQVRQYCVMECQSDNDCDYGLVCGRQGACTWPDLANEYARCAGDEECPDNFDCWWFQFDDPDFSYCLKKCGGDHECLEGQICGFRDPAGDGLCVDRCYTDQPGVCAEGWGCMLDSVNADDTAGHCHPAPTCSEDSECPPTFNICLLSELDRVAGGVLNSAGQGAPCVTGCGGGTTCQAGYKCLSVVAQELGGEDELPAVCLPNCAADGVCPPGFRCLRDLLEQFLPGRDWSGKDICFPGVSFVDLPCRPGQGDCYHGACADHPEDPVSYCAIHCSPQGACPYDDYTCVDANQDSVTDDRDWCFEAGCFTPGSTTECDQGQTCRTFDVVGDPRPQCSANCTDFRDGTCPVGQTCIRSDQGDFGCITGYQGLPCNDDNDCYVTGLGDVACLGSAGNPTDPDRICTRLCTTDADCDWLQKESSMAGYCRDPVCWPWAFECDPQSAQGPVLDCPTPEMVCLQVGNDANEGLCTFACTESRPADPVECPLASGCLTMNTTLHFCFPGVIGIPCAHNSECLEIFGQGTAVCQSITGSDLRVDGTCSAPCAGDETCRIVSATNGFCLPGVVQQDGRCFMNPTFENAFNLNLGRQGTFCYGTSNYCVPGYVCHHPRGQVGNLLDFCAQECDPMHTPPCDTPNHDCVQDQGGLRRICVPSPPYPDGRAAGAVCYDHRQCDGAVCFTEQTGSDQALEGYCTRACGDSGDCPPNWTCNLICRRPAETQ